MIFGEMIIFGLKTTFEELSLFGDLTIFGESSVFGDLKSLGEFIFHLFLNNLILNIKIFSFVDKCTK